jgi:hypothetical protein
VVAEPLEERAVVTDPFSQAAWLVVEDSSFWGPRCKRCGCTRYEHVDHDHWLLTHPDSIFDVGMHACPFGDCGEFQYGSEHR